MPSALLRSQLPLKISLFSCCGTHPAEFVTTEDTEDTKTTNRDSSRAVFDELRSRFQNFCFSSVRLCALCGEDLRCFSSAFIKPQRKMSPMPRASAAASASTRGLCQV